MFNAALPFMQPSRSFVLLDAKWNARSPDCRDLLLKCDAAVREAHPECWLFHPAMTASRVRALIEGFVPKEILQDLIVYLNNTRPGGFKREHSNALEWIEAVEKLGNTRHRPPKWYLDELRKSCGTLAASPSAPSPSSSFSSSPSAACPFLPCGGPGACVACVAPAGPPTSAAGFSAAWLAQPTSEEMALKTFQRPWENECCLGGRPPGQPTG
ncbi:hypothetical protein PAPYR_9734 [Paratrimastix pyriformis]|uniref:Uncharacterized protein n=1 Tax=Paratrimastix pyriformis TaxID=342808 RepID=A0ABQ8UCG7_9EUKA|nr:hypothetical protein PAPYR_9734 [Paratrimastix pyriformis]